MALKIVFKVISIVISLLVIIGLVFTYFIFTDAMDFKDKFAKGQKLFLLEGDNGFLTGFIISDMTKEGGIDYLDKNELEGIQNKGMESILGTNWKVLVIGMGAFDSINEISVNEETKITKQDINNILKNDDFSLLDGVDIDDDEVKASVFALLISEAFKSDPLFLLDKYKKGKIIVYPETMLFKTINIIPASLIESVLKRKVG